MTAIAVDAMGGDLGPRATVQGALAAARGLSIQVLLVGPEAVISGELARAGGDSAAVRVVHAPDVVEMREPPADALRRKPHASIAVAARLVASGEAAALVSIGHTGATVMAAHAAFGTLDGVDRPALAAAIPTRSGFGVIVDAGANIGCRPHHLVQFGVMGSVFAKVALGLERPRVGLLSIGAEENKGNDLTREAFGRLKASPVNFVGNVEARAVYSGQVDVVVCDGFTGNVAIKISEGIVDLIDGLVAEELAGPRGPSASLELRRGYRRLRRRLDDAEYGGAPLLGVAGLAVVGHGHSSPKAVRNAVSLAHRFAEGGLVARIQDEIRAIGA